MKEFWNELIQTGVKEGLSPAEVRKIRLLNGISFAGSLIIAAYLPVFLLLRLKPAITASGLGCFLCLFPIYLNQLYRYQMARIFFCVAVMLYFTVSALLFGEKLGAEQLIFAISILPLIFFRRRRVIIVFGVLSIIALLLSKTSFILMEPLYSHYTLEYFHYLNVCFTFVLLFVTVSGFKSEHETYEKLIEYKNEAILDSVKYAKRIQKAILGSRDELSGYFKDAFIFFKPKDIVSGDFFWFTTFQHESGTLFKIVIAADCTGHGVPGAFMTVMGNALLNEIINVQRIIRPCEILHELDKKVIAAFQRQNQQQTHHDGMDMAILVFEYGSDGAGKVHYAGAKSPLYVISTTAQQPEVREVKGSKFPIGSTQYKVPKTYQTHVFEINPGDQFYIFSDGFQDQFGGEHHRKFMSRHFRQLLLETSALPMKLQHEKLEHTFRQWKGKGEQTDDVLVIGVAV